MHLVIRCRFVCNQGSLEDNLSDARLDAVDYLLIGKTFSSSVLSVENVKLP